MRTALKNLSNFENKIYKVVDGLVTSSNLVPYLHNVYLCYCKQICHNEGPKEQVYYRIYVIETFLLFRFKDNIIKYEFKKVMAHLFF